MRAETAAERLQELLREAGFDDARPALAPLWAAVCDWVPIAVHGLGGHDADLVLFETAISLKPATRYSSGPHFWLGFTRQFSYPDDYPQFGGSMEQIIAQAEYEPDDDFRAVIDVRGDRGYGAQLWGEGGTDCAGWIAGVESDPAFRIALEHTPRSVDISQGLL